MSEEFFDGIVRWLHVTAAIVFIGPQVFLAFIAMPAMRTIEDARVRQAAVRRMTMGFGILGFAALAVLVATGIWQYYEFEQWIKSDVYPRYFFLIQAKLLLVTLVIALTVVHGMFFGRRLQRLQETGAPEDEILRVRRWSMVASMLNLAASLFIVLLATLMTSEWGKTP
jgi:uncharacterized membrane protein